MFLSLWIVHIMYKQKKFEKGTGIYERMEKIVQINEYGRKKGIDYAMEKNDID